MVTWKAVLILRKYILMCLSALSDGYLHLTVKCCSEKVIMCACGDEEEREGGHNSAECAESRRRAYGHPL